MRHLVLESWSRRRSWLHARDARAKILVAMIFLISLATRSSLLGWATVADAAILFAGIALGRLPLAGLLARAAVVLPFAVTMALFSLLSGDRGRAIDLLGRSYLSALAVLIVVASTPLPQLLRGLESLRAPRLLVFVVQMVYRYLFVLVEQGQRMHQAIQCRGFTATRLLAPSGPRRSRFRGAAGAIAVLFGRSYDRAENVHHAMLARGFAGRLVTLAAPRFRAADVWFLIAAGGLALAARLTLGTGWNR